ncbi:MAG: hypothetical protein L3J33_08985 [Rhodobacteraceae bacterium]|nr:hypothetical protein [Paracoccaceae bacterium]
MQKLLFALFVLTFTTAANAQDATLSLAEKLRLGAIMDAAAFKALTDGNTITYNNGTEDVYREYYRPGTNRIVIEWTEAGDPSQTICDTGTWYEENGLICFDWSASGSVCALWVDYEGEYISAISGLDGMLDQNLEVISTITTTPLYCEVGMVQLQMPVLNAESG